MKKLISLIPCLLASHSVFAADVDMKKMHQQLDIMENIVETSVASLGKQSGNKISSIESTYLMNQGVVFTIRSRGGRGHWGSFNFDIPVPPAPHAFLSDETIEQIEHAAEIVSDLDVDNTIAEAMETAAENYEEALKSLSQNRHNFSNLRDELRDLAYDLRDVERENRDLQYRLKRAETQHKKEIQSELKALAEKKVKLKTAQKEMKARTQQFKKQQEAQHAKSEQQRKMYYQGLSSSITEALCLYGNGLKALPKEEQVTVILKSAGDKVGRRYQDKIHVFSKRDIHSCATDAISSDKLLAKSKAYQF